MRDERLTRRTSRDRRALVFAPLAWLKLLYFCHRASTEVGGFGIAAADDPLYLEDFITVRQRVTPVSVKFDDQAVADFFDKQVDRGLRPDRFARHWLHTHPGESAIPSRIDEQTFDQAFGGCDWAVMAILARGGSTYARLAFAAGPGGEVALPIEVDWTAWPAWLNEQSETLPRHVERWRDEYEANIHVEVLVPRPAPDPAASNEAAEREWWDWLPWCPAADAVCYEPLGGDQPDATTFDNSAAPCAGPAAT